MTFEEWWRDIGRRCDLPGHGENYILTKMIAYWAWSAGGEQRLRDVRQAIEKTGQERKGEPKP